MKKIYVIVVLLLLCLVQQGYSQVLRSMTPRYNNASVKGNIVFVSNNIITSSGAITTEAPPGGTATNNGHTGLNVDVDGTINVVVDLPAEVEAGNAQSICAGATATLTGSSIGGTATSGTWTITTSPAGGDGALTGAGPDNSPADATFTATVPGAYTLTLTTNDMIAIDNKNCFMLKIVLLNN